jgi:hypothetical protein
MPRTFLEELRPGDRVWVDSRAQFTDHRLLREAEFVRWTDPDHPGWHNNEAVVRGEGLRRAPQVRPVYDRSCVATRQPVWDGTFLVDTMFLFDEAAARLDAEIEDGRSTGGRTCR